MIIKKSKKKEIGKKCCLLKLVTFIMLFPDEYFAVAFCFV